LVLLFYEVKNSEKRVCLWFVVCGLWFGVCEVVGVEYFQALQCVQKVGNFEKLGAAFPYFLFLVSYSLFPFRLSGKKNFNTFSLFTF
jgi:hypothetical protein